MSLAPSSSQDSLKPIPFMDIYIPFRRSSTTNGHRIHMNYDCVTYSIPQAGKLLGLSRNTAYEAERRGELPTIRFGRKILVPKAALQRLLDGAEPKGTQCCNSME